MAGVGGAGLVAGGAQVVIVTDEAFEAQPPEVALDAGITAHTCRHQDAKEKTGQLQAARARQSQRKASPPSWRDMAGG